MPESSSALPFPTPPLAPSAPTERAGALQIPDTPERLRALAARVHAGAVRGEEIAVLLTEAADELAAAVPDALRFRAIERYRLAVDGAIAHDWIICGGPREAVGPELRATFDRLVRAMAGSELVS